jgi:hypothetical protein
MMKQPAENTNATVAEEEGTRERAVPLSINCLTIREEVEKLAYWHWQERQGRGAGSADDDWFRAEKIVRHRLSAGMKA